MTPVTPEQGFVYGFIQGTTEVLPISSSAHLVLLPWFLGWSDPGLGFNVALHAGTLLAVLWYFGRDWRDLVVGAVASLRAGSLSANPEARTFWSLAAASVPGAMAGLWLAEAAETVFRSPALIATTLSLFGALLWLGDRRPARRSRIGEIGFADAVLIGVAQAFAIVPGVSRSGVTITMARALGIDRPTAARYSFLLATPIIAGATFFEADSILEAFSQPGQLVALASATAFGFLAIVGLIRFVRTRSFTPFVVYRLALAALIVWAG